MSQRQKRNNPLNIKNLTLAGLEEFMTSLGERPYRARQVFGWIYKKRANSFDEMTDLSKDLRDRLKGVFYITLPRVLAVESSSDGTKKLILKLEDKNCIECVLIPEGDRLTLCISTQVGCSFGCRFCATGRGGFVRNLRLSEVVNQVFVASGFLSPEKGLTNIVLMGMGEPLANYDEVSKFLKIATDQKGLGFATRKVTLSTVGLVPEIERLGKESKVNLAVSLNATTDDVRGYLMPINRRYPLKVLLNACRRYPLSRGRRITFEYVMIKGVNDSLEDARRLVKLLKGIPCKINLIPFNPFPGTAFVRPDEDTILGFQEILLRAHYTAFIRASRGQDIGAACGQLRGRYRIAT